MADTVETYPKVRISLQAKESLRRLLAEGAGRSEKDIASRAILEYSKKGSRKKGTTDEDDNQD